MRQIILIFTLLVLITACTQEVSTTTTRKITTTNPTTTTIATTTTTTTTTSTTTTTFYVPSEGLLCGELYTPELNSACDIDNMNFFVVAPERAKCTLGIQVGNDDFAYITVTNYDKSPYKGIAIERSPVFSLKSNIAVNETGEISARYIKSNMNEVKFLRNKLLVDVQTWFEGNRILCTSEQTLDIARIIDRQIKNG